MEEKIRDFGDRTELTLKNVNSALYWSDNPGNVPSALLVQFLYLYDEESNPYSECQCWQII